MAFTLSFPTASPVCAPATLGGWLTDRGEPHLVDGDVVTLRALPMRFVAGDGQASLHCHVDVTAQAALSRMIDVAVDVSVRAGADVHVAGRGSISRGALWMLLADEQDRLRLAESLARAAATAHREEIGRRLWDVLAAARPGHDDRWDAQQQRVVELLEVGDGISLEDARWHADDPAVGQVIAVPVPGTPHCLVWRWLSEAYPGLCEVDRSLH